MVVTKQTLWFTVGALALALTACGSAEQKSGDDLAAAKNVGSGSGSSSDAIGQGGGAGSGTGSGTGSGGAAGSGSGSGSGSAALTDVQAFEKTVYPVVRQYCVGC